MSSSKQTLEKSSKHFGFRNFSTYLFVSRYLFSHIFFKICEIQSSKKLNKCCKYFLVFDDLIYLLVCQSIKDLLNSAF